MEQFLTIENAYSYGIYLTKARHLTEEEKTHIKPEFWDTLYVGVGYTELLPHIQAEDLPQRPADGSFQGCSNGAYIISQAEWDAYVALNQRRAREAEKRALLSQIDGYMDLKDQAERQMPLPSREEAEATRRHWIAVENEGGEGYVPHFFCQEEYEDICRQLDELNRKTSCFGEDA